MSTDSSSASHTVANQFVLLASLLAVMVGGMVLVGWTFDIVVLKSVLPNGVPMKANTAICFILSGIALWLIARPPQSFSQNISIFIARLCSLLIGMIGLLTLGEYVFGWNLGIDQWLFNASVGGMRTPHPGRMSQESALSFTFLAIALAISGVSRKPRWLSYVSLGVGLLLSSLGLVALLSYLTPQLGPYGWFGLPIMAILTAMTFSILGAAVVLLSLQSTLRQSSLSRNHVLAIAAGLVLLVLTGSATSRSQHLLNELNIDIGRNIEVLREIDILMEVVTDTQAHALGLILTNNKHFETHYLELKSNCHKRLETLHTLEAGAPHKKRYFDHLEVPVKQLLQWMQQAIDSKRAGVSDAARSELLIHGDNLMKALHQSLDRMEYEHQNYIQQLQLKSQRVSEFTSIAIVFGTLSSSLLFLLVIFRLNLSVKAQEEAKQQLIESNTRFNTFFEMSPDPVLIINGHHFVDCNQAAVDILGYADKKILLNAHPSALSPEFQPDGESSFKKAERMMAIAEDVGLNRFEWVHQHANGSTFYVEVTLSTMTLQGQSVIYCTWRDITEKKLAEYQLNAQMKELQTLFSFGELCNLPGITQEVLLQKTVEILPKSMQYPLIACARIVFKQHEYRSKNFREPVSRLSAPLTLDAEEIGFVELAYLQALPSCEVDPFLPEERQLVNAIAERVIDAIRNMRAEAALQDSNSIFDSFLEHSPIYVFFKDENLRALRLSKNFEQWLGKPMAELLGKNMQELFPSALAQSMVEDDKRILREGTLVTIEEEMNGRIYSTIKFPISIKGKPTFLAGFTTDITEKKIKDDKLVKLSQAVEQSPNTIVITDLEARIEYANSTFTKVTGYTLEDALGKNSRILQSGKTPKATYVDMWANLMAGKEWRGELYNRRKDGSEYIEFAIISPVSQPDGQITNYLAIKQDITDKIEDDAKIAQLAHFDPLTDLPNRSLLNERFSYALSLAQRSGEPLAVMFLDLDHFKNINDTLGHSIGDRFLIEVAHRLKGTIRDEDTVSRLGGDEFILVFPGTDADAAAIIASKLIEAISQPYQIETHELNGTPSIGIAIYPNDGDNFEDLLKNADTAMYRVKRDSRNNFRFFTAEMQSHSERNLKLVNAMRHALARNEFHLQYQPQVSLRDGHLIGAEALLRWQHPKLGAISPAEFIPIAEDSGQIIPIGEWVLRTAVKQMKDWLDSGLPPMVIAVNLSAVQFRQPNLPELVTRILEETQLSPEFLELELTEAVAMDDPQSAIAVIDKLFECGIRMSIDDFGTGYSSLSYLKRFKVYKLKIDQSFVRNISDDPEDKAIVTAIINLASSLGMHTIAEGVETASQLAFLRLQGCDEVQGYYFSKPLRSIQFEEFVRKQK